MSPGRNVHDKTNRETIVSDDDATKNQNAASKKGLQYQNILA